MSVAKTAVMPFNGTPHGLGTGVHAEPCQCRIRAFHGKPVWPTAHTSSAATAVTAKSSLGRLEPEGFGLGTIVQAVPSQCSISVVLLSDAKSSACPTAQTSVAERAATPCSVARSSPAQVGLGLETTAK